MDIIEVDNRVKRRRSRGKRKSMEVGKTLVEDVSIHDEEILDTANSSSGNGKGQIVATEDQQDDDDDDGNQEEATSSPSKGTRLGDTPRKPRRRHRKSKKTDVDSGIGLDMDEKMEQDTMRIDSSPEKPVEKGEDESLPTTGEQDDNSHKNRKRRRKQKKDDEMEIDNDVPANTPNKTIDPPKPKPSSKKSSSKSAFDSKAWEWISLADPYHPSGPAAFTKDGKYFFVISSSSVKIHSTTSGEVVSTLSSLVSSHKVQFTGHTARITTALINPNNEFQLLTASLDGTIKIWDYLDAALLSTIRIGKPISRLCANANWKDDVFITTAKHSKEETGQSIYSTLYRVSLKQKRSAGRVTKPSPPSYIHKLGKVDNLTDMTLSPDGRWLVAIAEDKVHAALLSNPSQSRPFIFKTFTSPQILTCLAFHPSEEYFATGDKLGQIRLWYGLDEAQSNTSKRAQTKVLHWHAHAVSGLAFTPNGAYLLSGGEESVLVIWALEGGKKEFVPRVGSPISWVTTCVSAAGEGTGGLEYVLGLEDGTFLFIQATTLKVSRSALRMKLDPEAYSRSDRLPLVYHSNSSTIILPSSHPSSLQIYSPATSHLVAELEVSPSNRVSRRDDTPIEFAKVGIVCLDELGEWMVTVDSRSGSVESGGGKEVYLKIWEWRNGSWVLNTRIDRPHGEKMIVGACFAPSHSSSSLSRSGMLVTAGEDGYVRIWRLQVAKKGEEASYFWTLHVMLETRSKCPTQLTYSPDASLLAVAQTSFVTLHDTHSSDYRLIDTVSCPEMKSVGHITFVGERGRWLACAGTREVTLWDVVGSSVRWRFASDALVSHIIPYHSNETLVVLQHPYSEDPAYKDFTGALFFNANSPDGSPSASRSLPFRLRNITTTYLSGSDDELQIVGITDRWRVVLFGDHLSTGWNHSQEGTAPRRISGDTGISSRRTLFEDVFGRSAFVDPSINRTEASTSKRHEEDVDVSVALQLFDQPTHLMPSIGSLYDDAMSGFLRLQPLPIPVIEDAPNIQDQMEVAVDDEVQEIMVDSPGSVVTQQDLESITELFREIAVQAPTRPAPTPNGKNKSNGVSKTSKSNGTISAKPVSRPKANPSPTNGASAEHLSEPSSPSRTASPPPLTGSKRKNI